MEKQSYACFLIWLMNLDMWLGAVYRWDQSTALSDSGGYRVRSFWANIWDGTTQLCIIRVMWTSWDPLGLESFPSKSATTRRINVVKNNNNKKQWSSTFQFISFSEPEFCISGFYISIFVFYCQTQRYTAQVGFKIEMTTSCMRYSRWYSTVAFKFT